jgi:hypothetical protein
MKRIFETTLFAGSLLFPRVMFASIGSFADLVNYILGILNLVIPAIFGLTLIVFIWGLVKGWIINSGTESGAEEGKRMAIAGIIGLIVMTGMWGIIALAQSIIAF